MPSIVERRFRPSVARWLFVSALSAFGAVSACSGGGAPEPQPGTAGTTPSSTGGDSGAPGAETGGTATASGGDGGTTNDGGDPGVPAGSPNGAGEAGTTGSAPTVPPPRQYPDYEFVYDPPEAPPLTPDNACALGSTEAVPTPLDMYILFDRSGSMNLPQSMPEGSTVPGEGDCNVGDDVVSRWCYSINALDAFFGSPEAAGTGIALQFFPAGGCTSSGNPFLYSCCDSGDCCRGSLEATPAVSLLELPAARAELAAALDAEIPWADRTPIEAALRGMIDYTRRAARPNRQMIGLLVTDGGPEGCASKESTLANLVRSHLSRTGIPTYIVGTQGAAFSWLETIAAAGGAPEHTEHCAAGVRPCHFYNVGSGQPDVFIEVLQQIRRSAIACRFQIPEAEGGLVDPDEIALSFTPTGQDEARRVNRVASADDCTNAGGFYYDDNDDPQSILLCPSSCADFRAGDGGEVKILLGCKGS